MINKSCERCTSILREMTVRPEEIMGQFLTLSVRILQLSSGSFTFGMSIAKRGLKLPVGGRINYVHVQRQRHLSGIASSSTYENVRPKLSVWNCFTVTSVDNMVMMRSNPRVMHFSSDRHRSWTRSRPAGSGGSASGPPCRT